MRCLSGLASAPKNKKEFLHLRLFRYISGKLSNTCHHPGLSGQAPARCKSRRGFSLCPITMPKAAPKPCSQPGCGVLVRDGTSRCSKHQREAWAKKPTATKRVTGRRLQALRAELFARNPLCAECERQGRVTLATQRDHVISLEEGGTDDDSNVQGLCPACHEAKSKAERIRGQRRAAG